MIYEYGGKVFKLVPPDEPSTCIGCAFDSKELWCVGNEAASKCHQKGEIWKELNDQQD